MSTTQPEKRSQSQRREATRQAILQACLDVMAEEDFSNSKTGTIAKRAGVAEGTVFLHFESKQGLLRALIEKFFDVMHGNIERIHSAHHCPKQRLKSMAEDYIYQLEAQWPLAKLVVSSHARYGDKPTQQALNDHNRRYTQFFIDALEEIKQSETEESVAKSIPSKVFRDALFGGIEHFAIANFNTGKTHDSQQFLDHLWQLLFNGILSQNKTENQTEKKEQTVEDKLDRILKKLDA